MTAPVGPRAWRRGLVRGAAVIVLLTLSLLAAGKALEGAISQARWSEHRHLHLLLTAVFGIGWVVLLFPTVARRRYRAMRAHPRAAIGMDLVLLLLVAMALVSIADLGFYLGGRDAVSKRLKTDVISTRAWVTNSLLLLSLFGGVYAVARRVITAVIVVAPVYLLLVIASYVKLRYIHSVVQPLDLLRIPELLPIFTGFFGRGVAVLLIAGAVLWVGGVLLTARLTPVRAGTGFRLAIAAASLAVPAALTALFFAAVDRPRAEKFLELLGVSSNTHREAVRETGILLTFVSELPALRVVVPAGYDSSRIAAIVNRHGAPASGPPPRVDVIVYMVESFMDPADLGYDLTADPIPTVRGLLGTNGFRYAIVPTAFAGSSRSEFEILTGMSTAFLPPRSLPYRQYLRRPVPSLPRALRELGYTTVAIQADPRHYYDRERAYAMLGFDQPVWLGEVAGVPKDDRLPWWPTDDAVVDAALEASARPGPSFVFAFPTTTHSPYDRGTFSGSDLDVRSLPPGDERAEVKEYVNALRRADSSIARLITGLSGRDDSTLVVIVGDHLPPLSPGSLRGFIARTERLSQRENYLAQRRVPLAVWSNFPIARGDSLVGLSAVPGIVLELIGAPLDPWFAAIRAAHRRIPVIAGHLTRDGRPGPEWLALPEEERRLLAEHQLLQHDLLLGSQFALAGRRR